MNSKGIIGPFWFADGDGVTVTVYAQWYRSLQVLDGTLEEAWW